MIKSNEIFFGVVLSVQRKIHYIKWDTVTLPKKDGGMGIHKSLDKNKVALTSLTWRLLNHPHTTWETLLKNTMIDMQMRLTPSFGKTFL